MGKRIENRSRPIPKALVGCRVAIHAGAALPLFWAEQLAEYDPGANPHLADDDIVTRHIVATAVLARCAPPLDFMAADPAFCMDWGFRRAKQWWILEDVRTLARLIPMQRGQLGLWNLPEDISNKLENQ
jgi:hypothetical protein